MVPGIGKTLLLSLRKISDHDNGSIAILSPQKKASSSPASGRGRCCCDAEGAALFESPRAVIDGGCRGNHVVDEKDVQTRAAVACAMALGQAAQGGSRPECTFQIQAPVAAAARSLRWGVPNATHQIGPEGNLHLPGHDSGEQIGLVVAAAQPFQRVKRNSGHHGGSFASKSTHCACPRQSAERQGRSAGVRKFEEPDQGADRARVGRSRRAPFKAQQTAPASGARSRRGQRLSGSTMVRRRAPSGRLEIAAPPTPVSADQPDCRSA